jgi:hypothetical protein
VISSLGGTWSRRCAAESAIRRLAHDGQSPSILTGEGDEQLIVVHRTANAGKAAAEQPAAQVALKLGANAGRKFAAGITLLCFDEEGSQVFPNNAVEQSLFRLTMLVAPPNRGRTTDFLPLR